MHASTSALSLILLAAAGAGMVWLSRQTPQAPRAERATAARAATEIEPERIVPIRVPMKDMPRRGSTQSSGDLDTEWAIRAFFYGQPEASTFEVLSMKCWNVDCELRVVAFGNGEAPAQGGFRSNAIEAIASRYARSELSQRLTVSSLTSYYLDDRTVYTLAFTRGPS